ncbi:MAG TPA: restriction endonuclease [Pirellulales bacterium]|nr:restriction endonuclease [Pirellulales bacterium]
MAIWLIRAEKHGEYEQKFLQEKRVYVTWGGLATDLLKLKDRQALIDFLADIYPNAKPKRLSNWASQIWPFAHEMKKGDLVVLPLKSQPAINIGEITGDYSFEANGPDPFYHWRSVKWIADSIPRSHFGKDLLHSFGAFMTICRIKRNDAESRINAMRQSGWKPDPNLTGTAIVAEATDESIEPSDLEELGRDHIAQLIIAKFKGHGLARLVDAILRAQGYTTYLSPEGRDRGADILAGAGPLGFSSPHLCVQVKSEDSPIGRPEIDKLEGVMKHFHASEALFVSWSGFKSNVYSESSTSFFSVRLWSQKELLEALFAHYDQLDDDLKAELPLKRIWTVAVQEDD